MNDCVFCKIIREEIPSDKVYEDDNVLAFLDIKPVSSGHTLLIPKVHSENLLNISEEHLANLMSVLPKVAKAIIEATGASGFNVGINNGADAGQIIFHTHIHIIPRNSKDNLQLWAQHDYQEGEATIVAKKIRETYSLQA